MIGDMFSQYLKSAERRGDFTVPDISIHEASDLAGWVVADAIPTYSIPPITIIFVIPGILFI